MSRFDVLTESYVAADHVLYELYAELYGGTNEGKEPVMDAIHDILYAIESHPGNLFYIAEAARGNR